MIVEIREMTGDDAAAMAERMRPIDRLEFEIMGRGKSMIECFNRLRACGECRVAYVDGRLAACWGIYAPTVLSTNGNPWMVATDLINKPQVRREFVRHTKPELLSIAQGFTHLWNLVLADNKIAIKFIKWIGFEFEPDPIDVRGHAFLKFTMEA